MAMQKDNLSMDDGLQQMKSDYEYLKAGMDKQTIINRQLMERVFRDRTRVLTSNRTTALVSISAAILVTLALSYVRGVDMRIAGIVAGFFALMLIGYGLIYRKLGKIEYGTADILSTVTRLRKFKRNYMIVNTVSWILAAGLLCFMIPEIYGSYSIPQRGIAAIVFICAAVIAGICIQYLTDRKVLRSCDAIIDNLKDRS